jgi:ABC-type Na+ efflux pump permease subunit
MEEQIENILSKQLIEVLKTYNWIMSTLSLHIFSILKLLLNKFVEAFIKSFKKEKLSIGVLATGMQNLFLVHLQCVKNTISISQYALRTSITCLSESSFNTNMKTCSKTMDLDLLLGVL